MTKSHYKVDRRAVQQATRRDREREREEAAHHGFYQYPKYSLVPLDKIKHQDVWHPGRIKSIRKAIERGKPLPPIRADKEGSKYVITDGIHRYNASLEAGFTHIPVLEYVTVEAPELYVPPEPQKPVLKPGQWVKLKDPPRHLSSPWAVVVEHLGTALDRGVKRHMYELLGMERREPWIIGDWRDSAFEIGGRPPARVRDAIEGYQREILRVAAKGPKDLPEGSWVEGGATMGPSTKTILAATRVADRWLREAAIFEPPPEMLEEAVDTIVRFWAEGLLRFVEDKEQRLKRTRGSLASKKRFLQNQLRAVRADLQDLEKDPGFWAAFTAPTNSPDLFKEEAFEHDTLHVRALTEEEKAGHRVEGPHFYTVRADDDKYRWGEDIPKSEFRLPWSESSARSEIVDLIENGFENIDFAERALQDHEATLKDLKALAVKHGARNAVQGSKPYQMEALTIDLSGWKYLRGRIGQKDAENALRETAETVWATFDYTKRPSNRLAQWSHSNWVLTVWAPNEYSMSVYTMERVPKEITRSTRHEMQHFAQDALKVIFDLPEIAGLPPAGVRTPDQSVWGEPPGRPGEVAPHELRDIEFQTRLADAVDEFMGDLNKVPIEHWRAFIKKFTAAEDSPKPLGDDGRPVLGWYENAWFERMKRGDRARWKAAVGKFVSELDRRGVMTKIKRTNQWAPVVVPDHDAWGLSVMRYRTRRLGDLMPSRPPGMDWTEWQGKRKTHERKHWPTIKREYEQFIDSLSEEQLVRHKLLVNKKGDLEYWITPRLQNWDGAEKLPPSREVDHPRLPKRHRY